MTKSTGSYEPDTKRTLLVMGDKTFRIVVPAKAKITFAPWSPPSKDSNRFSDSDKRGTLRIYEGVNIVAVFSGVSGYRDTALDYSEQVARMEGDTVWRSDERGYERSSRQTGKAIWVRPQLDGPGDPEPELPPL